MTLYISNSELVSFTRCRRKWWFQNYLGARERNLSPVGPLPFGTRFHSALEAMYVDGRDPVDRWSELVADDRVALQMLGYDTKPLDDDDDLGRIMLSGWVDWVAEQGLDAHHEILGVEDTLSLPLEGRDVVLVAKADMRVRHREDRTVRVIDFKTAASFSGYTATSHMNTQAKMYLMLDAATREDGDIADGFVFRVAKKVKRSARATPPFYEEFHVRHSAQSIELFQARVTRIVDEILATRAALDAGAPHHEVAYCVPDQSCSFMCPLFKGCTLFDDGASAAEAYVEENFTLGNNSMERYGSTLPTATA